MNFRIKQHPKGFVVEVQKKCLWFKYWTHFISVSGIDSLPWYHSTYEHAERNLLNEIKWQTIKNSDL